MIHVVTCISYEADLLPHFVEYYLALGVDSFIIAIDERVPGIEKRTAEIAAQLPAKIRLVPASERQRQTGVEGNNKEETRRRFVPPEDWMIPADLDEFIQFPCPLPQLLDEMKAASATFIMGYFSDRLAEGGALAKIQTSPSVWEQYPLEAPVSEMLVGCWCHKVTLCRGDCELTSGHHHVIRPAVPLLTRRCVVHHFKWRGGAKEALERRVATYRQAKFPVQAESERVLEYLTDNGRILPEEFAATPGWNPKNPPKEKDHVIYTSITDDYDVLKDPPFRAQVGSDLVAFTDGIHPSRFWQMREAHREFADPCRNAKIHKILAHQFFPNAKYSLWVDGSVRIKTPMSLEELAELYLKNADIAVFAHRSRDCIYQEAQACINAEKDDPAVIRGQMKHYRYENYPTGAGLAECPVILRRHTKGTELFNEIWWNEIETHSRRDQLSFNYVAWKLRIRYAVFPGKLNDNDLFEAHKHSLSLPPPGLNYADSQYAISAPAPTPLKSREVEAKQALDNFRTFRKLRRLPTGEI